MAVGHSDREPAPDYRLYELHRGVRVVVMPVRLPPWWRGKTAVAVSFTTSKTGEVIPQAMALMDVEKD